MRTIYLKNIHKKVIKAYTYNNKNTRGKFFMEYAKDEVFQIRYNTNLNRLQIGHERWTNRLLKTMKRHKLITTAIISFFMFSTVNVIMIYNFMKILQNI